MPDEIVVRYPEDILYLVWITQDMCMRRHTMYTMKIVYPTLRIQIMTTKNNLWFVCILHVHIACR